MEENGQHKKTRKKEKRLSFWYILGGGVLKEDFILRHTRMIVSVSYTHLTLPTNSLV